MEMDHRRVSRLKIKPLRAANAPGAPPAAAAGSAETGFGQGEMTPEQIAKIAAIIDAAARDVESV